MSVYVEINTEVPRHRQFEAAKAYEELVFPWDMENMPRVGGGQLVGVFYTVYGKTGELVHLMRYPDLNARDKVLAAFYKDTELQKKITQQGKWLDYARCAYVRVLRPTSFSPELKG